MSTNLMKTNLMKFDINKPLNSLVIAFISTLLLVFSTQVFAINLQSAKAQGLVGETASGYLSAVKAASNEVKALIQDINSKRKQVYAQIAKRNGTTLSAVEHLAGKKAIEKSKPGSYIKPADRWLRK